MDKKDRRRFLGYLAGALGAMAATGAFWLRRQSEPSGAYRVVDKRQLPTGGLGLFIAVEPGVTKESLKALGDSLRSEFQGQPNMVVTVFDDAEAAQTVRKGSRIVGEDLFQKASAHQVALYIKDSRTGRHVMTIFGESKEEVHYAAG